MSQIQYYTCICTLPLRFYHLFINIFDCIPTDELPPLLSCKPSRTVLIPDETTMMTIDPLDFISSVEQGATTSSDTGTLRLTKSDINTVRTTRITATDSSGNVAHCSIQIKVECRSFVWNNLYRNLTAIMHNITEILYSIKQWLVCSFDISLTLT